MRLSDVLRSGENPISGGRRLIFYCPACMFTHSVNVEGHSGPQWTFNGNVDKPTFNPSVKVNWSEPSDMPHEVDDRTKDIHKVCHFFIRDGKIEFCNDCTHDLKGQTVDMVRKYEY